MDNSYVGVFSIGQTIDRGIRLYKQAFSRAVLLLILPSVFGLSTMFKAIDPNPSNHLGMFGPAYFISLFLGLWAAVVMIRYMYQLSIGEKLTMGQILRLASPKDLLYIFTYLIAILMMLAFIIPLAIPFIYFINLFYLSAVIAVVERQYFTGWIGRAFRLTKKRWWKTFVINVITCVMCFAPIFIVFVMVGLSAAGSAMSGQSGNAAAGLSKSVSFIVALLYVLSVSLLTPLFFSINIVHYNSLRAEKESADLEKALDSVVVQNA
jgi:hypothetical protein